MCPADGDGCAYFNIDSELTYEHFFADFGPLNLGALHRYCDKVRRLLGGGDLAPPKAGGVGGGGGGVGGAAVCHVCSEHLHRRTNAAYLAGSFLVLHAARSPEAAFRPFLGIDPPLIPYRDAAFGLCTWNLTVLDCLSAVGRAVERRFYEPPRFSLPDFDRQEKLENGDTSWIAPGKLLAFSGPIGGARRETKPGVFAMLPEEYVPLFKRLGVTAVVRFNKHCYDRRVFVDGGVRHFDLEYPDGGNPTPAIMRRFLEVVEGEPGAVAVHCKAGLGRACTNISCYLLKHFGLTAAEAIAWCRICRPGAVVGPQQQFLEEHEDELHEMGRRWRAARAADAAGSGGAAGAAAAAAAAGRGAGRGGRGGASLWPLGQGGAGGGGGGGGGGSPGSPSGSGHYAVSALRRSNSPVAGRSNSPAARDDGGGGGGPVAGRSNSPLMKRPDEPNGPDQGGGGGGGGGGARSGGGGGGRMGGGGGGGGTSARPATSAAGGTRRPRASSPVRRGGGRGGGGSTRNERVRQAAASSGSSNIFGNR